MRLEARKYLLDIQIALERLTRFTAGKRFDQYASDELLRSAVERQLGVVGEALARLAKDDADVVSGINQWRQIVAFRNILIHGYASVDDRIVWGVLENHLVPLRHSVTQLLARP